MTGAAGAAPPGPALFPIEVAGKHGMIDRSGKVAIPAEYDKAGALVVPAAFDRATKFSEGLAAAKLDKHHGFVDRAGTWAISPRYAWVRPFHQGLAYVGEPGARGAYVDPKGRVVWESK